ncbi:10331_t:CDS:2, partial [Ambispora leptoticha]
LTRSRAVGTSTLTTELYQRQTVQWTLLEQQGKIKVSKVPLQATIEDLRYHFSSYGKVIEVKIDEEEGKPTGMAFITFKPPYDSVISIIKWQNKGDTLPAESLEIGVYSQPNTFVPEWNAKTNVSFSLDYKRKMIIIEFKFQNNLYKVENLFQYVEGEFYIELDVEHDSRARITFATKYPGKYWILDEKTKTNDKFYWSVNEMWKRRIDLFNRRDNLRMRPLEPSFTDGTEHFGKWVVYRITFLLDCIEGKLTRFKEVVSHAGEYNLAEKQIDLGKKPLNVGRPCTKYVERRDLDFEVLYMVECCVTHNYLHDYNLNRQFFEDLKKLSKDRAVEIMKTFFTSKTRNFNPLSELTELKKNVKGENVKPPEYCVLMRKVVITPTTMYLLLPTIETSNRVIRLFMDHKDRFLRVQFTDEGSSPISSTVGSSHDAIYNRIFRTLQYGIKIGNRHYEFLAFSSSQLREHSCWFFASSDTLTAANIRERMGYFTDNVVAKYAARMGQCFSSTRAIVSLPVNDIKLIDDIKRNGYTFSDGIGKISPNLARQIAEKMKLRSTPSAVQFRLGGYKGVLCVSRHLKENQIQVRPSQRKFESPDCELEIIKGSTFIPAYLNRQAITLLSALGVPDEIFTEMKDEQVKELEKMLSSDNTAMKVLLHNIDEHGITRIMADLVKAGFLYQRDPFILNLIALFRIMMLKNLKDKAKISVRKGAFLLGVIDETESLKEDQIYVCRSDVNNTSHKEVIEGPCIVYRNPCFHPGDIRMVTAVNCPKLDYLVDVVVFPSLGYRDIPNQCSGGDLDGDDYTIIWDERLFPKVKNYTPMEYQAPEPVVVPQVKIEHIRKFFVNYILNDNLGQIANAHLAKADFYETGAFHGSCLRLAQLHSEAVDFPKTGRPAKFPSELRVKVVPDFMDKGHKQTYISKKILGKLYRSIQINEFNPSTDIKLDDRLLNVEGYEKFLDDARVQKRKYDSCVRGLMNQYGIESEYEVVTGFIVNPVTKNERKKLREISKSVMDAITGIRHKFQAIFEREFNTEGPNQASYDTKKSMHAKACAWYYVTYFPSELGDNLAEHMLSFPWCVHDLLCEIATKNTSRSKSSIEELLNSKNNENKLSAPPRTQKPPSRSSKKPIWHEVPQYHGMMDLMNSNDEDGGIGKLHEAVIQSKFTN